MWKANAEVKRPWAYVTPSFPVPACFILTSLHFLNQLEHKKKQNKVNKLLFSRSSEFPKATKLKAVQMVWESLVGWGHEKVYIRIVFNKFPLFLRLKPSFLAQEI